MPRIARITELELLVIPAVLVVLGMVAVTMATEHGTSVSLLDLWIALVLIGLMVMVHVWLTAARIPADQMLLPLVAILVGIGLVMIYRLQYSLSRTLGPGYSTIAVRQTMWAGIGFVVMIATVSLSGRLEWLRKYKYTWVLIGLGLAAATSVFGTGPNGAKLWFNFRFFQFQPSELLKVLLVVFLAAYLDDKRDLLSHGFKLGPLSLPPLPYLMPLGLMWAGTLGLSLIQKDLGSALLFFGVFLAMLYAASGRASYVWVGLPAFLGGAAVLYHFVDRVQERVSVWLDPWGQAFGNGYQIVQGLYALASGGVIGAGIGRGHPAYIPEVHTDFIFAAVSEELGFAGALAILAIYLLLVFRAFHIALSTRNGFHRLLATGLASLLGLQSLIIIGGVIRMIPLTGITLPFMSYGGSSLLVNFVIVGLLLRISSLARMEESQ